MVYLAVICGLLVALNAWQVVDRRTERREVAAERGGLLQRIQAPQAAVAQHHYEGEPIAPPAVSEFDDDDYWASKEDMADRLAEQELTGG